MRPPYGNINKRVKSLSDKITIKWDVDTLDWKTKNSEKVKNHIISHAHDGAIILLHDLYETSVDGALEAMAYLKEEGYAFVTINEMAELKGKTLNSTETYYNIK